MTTPQRVRCAAADFWGDKHLFVNEVAPASDFTRFGRRWRKQGGAA